MFGWLADKNVRAPCPSFATCRFFRRGEATAEAVFGDDAGHEKILQVFASTRLGAAARHFESAERMTLDHRAGDHPVDIKIPADQFIFHASDIDGAARVTSSRQREFAVVCECQCFIKILRPGNGEDWAEDFFAKQTAG